MKEAFDLDCFYFVSGYDKIHTGHELLYMIELGCVGPDAHCKITGIHEMLLWFKEGGFSNETRIYNFTKRLVHQPAIVCTDIVSSICAKPIKVQVIRNSAN